jgi:RNA polymerase sigma factor (sigma-70 family)
MQHFIRGALRMAVGKISAAETSAVLGGMQHGDLFQSTILRLVENDCAVLKRFSGKSEYEWIAYLAVITRSVVRESLRRQRALKRPGGGNAVQPTIENLSRQPRPASFDPPQVERGLLAQEVKRLGKRAIHNLAGESSTRDMLIFQLYFDHDLSFSQIAQCRNVKLTKAGVEKALGRLKEMIRSAVSEESSKETDR